MTFLSSSRVPLPLLQSKWGINAALVSWSRASCFLLFYLCFLLLAFVSGHHHSHHPVSVGGSSFPMLTILTHTHTYTQQQHHHHAYVRLLWLWKQTFTLVYRTLRCNIRQVVQVIKCATSAHRWNKTIMEDYWSPLKVGPLKDQRCYCAPNKPGPTAAEGPSEQLTVKWKRSSRHKVFSTVSHSKHF